MKNNSLQFIKNSKLTVIPSANKNFRKKDNKTNTYFNESANELDLLIKKISRGKRLNFLNYVNCPVCNTKTKEKNFIKVKIFYYVKCFKCSHVFLKNQIKEKILLKQYKHSNADKKYRLRKEFKPLDVYWNKIYQKYLKILFLINKTSSTLIDVGCGDGRFLNFCINKYKNLKCYGIELASDQKQRVSKLIGAKYFFNKPIEKINFKETFDLISFWGVIEHLSNPAKVFKSVKKIMNKNSLIIILVPNIKSLAIKLLGPETPTLSPRNHINFFTQKSLNILLKKMNLKILHHFQELPVIDLMYRKIKVTKSLRKKIIRKQECYYSLYIIVNK